MLLYAPLYHNKIAVKVNVGQARLMVPESLIIVRGNIVQRIGQDLYVFEDDSSSILATIPDSVRGNTRYDKRKLVELHGELSKSPTSVKIRVAKVVHLE